MSSGRLLQIAIIGILVGGVFLMFRNSDNGSRQTASSSVKIPALTDTAMVGKELFAANCAKCHSADGSGTDQGPPLIHIYYEPNHHSDFAFYRAVKQGVVAHHWRFGNMPPVPEVKRAEVTKIIAYIRQVQQANGIF